MYLGPSFKRLEDWEQLVTGDRTILVWPLYVTAQQLVSKGEAHWQGVSWERTCHDKQEELHGLAYQITRHHLSCTSWGETVKSLHNFKVRERYQRIWEPCFKTITACPLATNYLHNAHIYKQSCLLKACQNLMPAVSDSAMSRIMISKSGPIWKTPWVCLFLEYVILDLNIHELKRQVIYFPYTQQIVGREG